MESIKNLILIKCIRNTLIISVLSEGFKMSLKISFFVV